MIGQGGTLFVGGHRASRIGQGGILFVGSGKVGHYL